MLGSKVIRTGKGFDLGQDMNTIKLAKGQGHIDFEIKNAFHSLAR